VPPLTVTEQELRLASDILQNAMSVLDENNSE
jgi:acetylornithine aminotransferase